MLTGSLTHLVKFLRYLNCFPGTSLYVTETFQNYNNYDNDGNCETIMKLQSKAGTGIFWIPSSEMFRKIPKKSLVPTA